MKRDSWRKLVSWNNETKMYNYKGHEIFPLSFDEQYSTPMHIQTSYYWDELNRIDKQIEIEKNNNQMTESVDKSMEYFFEIIGGWIYVLFKRSWSKGKKMVEKRHTIKITIMIK